MKAALIALTRQGVTRVQAIAGVMPGKPDIFVHEHCMPLPEGARPFQELNRLLPDLWEKYRLFVFIMASGIVVRQIAPLIRSKDRDPAVLVGDEAGKFLIPLLSGHLGGANAWARFLQEKTGAQAVITTATDVNGLVAPDDYARRLGWKIAPLHNLPVINRHLVETGYLVIVSEFQLSSEHPLLHDSSYLFPAVPLREGSEEKTGAETAHVIISAFPQENSRQVYLVPPVLSIGVGCRRGIRASVIQERIDEALNRTGASRLALKGLYSIDLKAAEPGLLETAKQLGVPLLTFPAALIQRMNEERGLSRSGFVRQTIGVDGVCEAASLLGTRQGRLILPKLAGDGVTIALSLERYLSSGSVRAIPNI